MGTRTQLAVGIVTAATLAGCATSGSDSNASTTSSVEASVEATESTTGSTSPETTESSATTAPDTETTASPTTDGVATPEFDVEPAEFSNCFGGLMECATVTVPIEPSDPSVGTLDIAINVHRANNPDERVGVLLINPGGPGGSGLDMAKNASFGYFPANIVDRFDIVGFDPRGVGESEPFFTCGDSQEWIDRLNEVGEVDSDADVELVDEGVQSCIDEMGPAASRLGTDYVAHDMDVIREALGEDQITFYGASYGSTIGAWYASRFPDRVRAMVVDGADNPNDDYSSEDAAIESELEETVVFEAKLREALEACVEPSCPIYNDGDPVGFFLDHTDDLSLVNDEFDGHPDAGAYGVVSFLYNEDEWPDLWQAMAELADGNPAMMVESAEFQFQGQYGANITGYVNCLDSWALQPDLTGEDRLALDDVIEPIFEEQQPLLAAMWTDQPNFCAYREEEVPEVPAFDFDGGDVPVVVIANVSDPATPYDESIEMYEGLSNGFLVEVDYPAHVVYGDDECATEVIDEVLTAGEPPAEKVTKCPPSEIPDDADSFGDVPNEAVLAFVCEANVGPDQDPEQLNAACEAIVERGTKEFADVNLGEAFDTGDPEVLDAVFSMVGEEYQANGIQPGQ